LFHNLQPKERNPRINSFHNLQHILIKLKPENKQHNTASHNKVLSIISHRMVNNTVYSNTRPRAHSNQIHGAGPIILITFLALLNIVFSIILLYLILRCLRRKLTVNNFDSPPVAEPEILNCGGNIHIL
jgi:hypothetical protein